MADITNPHDRFFKATFTHPETAADFLQSYLPPEVAALLDPDPAALELVKESFIDPDLSQHYSDLLYRVRLRDGGEAFVYVVMEHKSYPDPLTGFQVLRYMVRIWERELQRDRRAVLTPIIPVVLYHGRERWQVAPEFGALFTGPEALRRYWPDFAYRLTDLSLYSDEAIRGAVRLRAMLVALRYFRDPQLWHRLQEVPALLRAIERKETALESLQAILRYLGEVSDHVTREQLVEVGKAALDDQGEGAMATVAEVLREEGRQQGIELGKQEGLQEGLREGIRTGLRAGIELALDLKFGADGLALLPEINAIQDVEALRAVHAAIRSAATPEDVRAAY